MDKGPLKLPCTKEEFQKATKERFAAFVFNGVNIILSVDNGKWHISMSHGDRIPTYEEMKNIRYELLPDNCYMAQIFPPKKEFVNFHKFTLHLHEIDR